jgi:signal transduction histidine kinase
VLAVSLRQSGDAGVSQILYLRDITHESEVDRLKSEFLSTAAHELRTPMASIYGFAEVLMTQKVAAHERMEFLSIIFKQAALMSSILNELLDLARIEARRGKDFVIQACSVQSLVAEVVAGFKLPAGRNMAQLQFPKEPVSVNVDSKKAAQALLNVLSNAYKYANQGEVLVDIKSVADEVAICVTDHGPGLTPEQVKRIGERFYRVDTSGKVPGTGLGMSIVREIMALHRGRVDIDSTPGQGTTVSLVFPRAD